MLLKVANEYELQGKSTKGKIDLLKVERAVASSQPKRASDIQSHAKYVQIWGGGSSKATFAKEITEYVQAGVINTDLGHVSSGFLMRATSLNSRLPSSLLSLCKLSC